jgi:hypothetical protein
MHRITTPLANRMGILFNWANEYMGYYNSLYYSNFKLIYLINYFFNESLRIK